MDGEKKLTKVRKITDAPIFSPVPTKKPTTYSFFDALREVANGRKITRLEWNTNEIYGLLKDTFLELYKNGEYFTWTVNDGDMTATDWIILPI